MMHIRDIALNMDERSLLCQIVNHVGGDGPYADDRSIGYFTVEHCVACIEKTQQRRSLTPSGQLLALAVEAKLKERAA